MTSSGVDVPAAIRHWREAGFTVRDLAERLSLHPSTIYRWGNGQRFPRPANLTALREEVDMRYAQENARHNLTVVGAQLASAYAALEDPEERAEFEARMRVKRNLILQRRARHAQRVDRLRTARQRKPVTSVTAQITDPFALVGEPEPALPF